MCWYFLLFILGLFGQQLDLELVLGVLVAGEVLPSCESILVLERLMFAHFESKQKI